jgi:O-antigen ligase
MQNNISNFWGIINTQGNRLSQFISFSIVALLIAQPIFLFSIGGWVTRVGIAIYVACLISLLFDRLAPQLENVKPTKLYWWIVFSLGTYFLATGLSQMVNGTFVPNRLDAPSRLLFSILIFYAVFKYRIDFSKILQISIPLSITFFFLFIELRPDQITLAKSFWGGRYSLPFIDPILLSVWLTCFGLVCLMFTNDEIKFLSISKNLIFILCVCCSLYMTLITSSRVSLLAIPIIIIIFIFKPLRLSTKFLITLFTLTIFIYFTLTLSITLTRVNAAFLELTSYLSTDSKETAIGVRIQMGDIALKALSLKPFFGWSESFFNNSEINTYLSINYYESTLFLAKNTGFHSDIYAAMVRSGTLGIFAYLATFLTPLFLFFYLLVKGLREVKNIALAGLAIIVTCMIASTTVEILAYKYSVTIFSYLIAGLMAQALWKHQVSKINS